MKFSSTVLVFAVQSTLLQDHAALNLVQLSDFGMNQPWHLLHTEKSDFYPYGVQVLQKNYTLKKTKGLSKFTEACERDDMRYLSTISSSTDKNELVLPLRCMVYGTSEYKGERVIYPHSCIYPGRFWHLVPDYMRFYSGILASAMLFKNHDEPQKPNSSMQKSGFLGQAEAQANEQQAAPVVRALVLGAGGGSLSRLLKFLMNDRNVVVHNVELDPSVVKVAHDYFDFDARQVNERAKVQDQTTVFIEDALKFVQQSASRATTFLEERSNERQVGSASDQHDAHRTSYKYDIVIQDICGKIKTPNAFLTQKWFSRVKAMLKDKNSRFVINALDKNHNWRQNLGDAFGTGEIARISDYSLVWNNPIYSITPQKEQPKESTVWGRKRPWANVGVDFAQMENAIEVVKI